MVSETAYITVSMQRYTSMEDVTVSLRSTRGTRSDEDMTQLVRPVRNQREASMAYEICAPSRKQGLKYRYKTASGNRRPGSSAPIVADKGLFWMKPEPRGKLNVRRTEAKKRSCTQKAERYAQVRAANGPQSFGIKEATTPVTGEVRKLSSRERRQLKKEGY